MSREEEIYTLVILMLVGLSRVKSCPIQCTCNLIYTVVNCARASITNEQLKDVIQSIPLNTTYVTFMENSISQLSPQHFANLRNLTRMDLSRNQFVTLPNISYFLPNLKELILSFNDITSIKKEEFIGYENIRELRLSTNQITRLTSELFVFAKELRNLNLGNNKISKISKDAFSGLSNLTVLSLYRNPFSKIENGTFDSLPLKTLTITYTNLETISSYFVTAKNLITALNLHNNRISTIDENAFYNLHIESLWLQNNNLTFLKKEMFKKSLIKQNFDVSGNNLRCSCIMFEFLEFLITPDIEGKCRTPSILADQELKIFKEKNDLTCNTTCSNHPCKNNGTCRPMEGKKFHCECEKGYAGHSCQSLDYCLSDPCKHNSTCLISKNTVGFLCQCSEGYEGDLCQKINPCFNNSCTNNGSCEGISEAKYKCNCRKHYSGKHCEELKKPLKRKKAMHPGWIALFVALIMILVVTVIAITLKKRGNSKEQDLKEEIPLRENNSKT